MAWQVARGPAPDWVHRRFGSDHAKPCLNPKVTTCAMSECQRANRCAFTPTKEIPDAR